MGRVERQWLQVNKRTGRDMEDEHINPELFDEMNESLSIQDQELKLENLKQ